MHAAVVDIARNCAGLDGADTTENNPNTRYPVIGLITEWIDEDGNIEYRDEDSDLGGTMRMGEQVCKLSCDSMTARIYGAQEIKERHRHRYEVNINYKDQLEEAELNFGGLSPDGQLPETIEYADHPWFIGVQYHPELKSRPLEPHPLFASYIAAALAHSRLV